MDKKTVKEMLEGAKEKDYIEIISKMTLQSPNTEKAVIDWCRKIMKSTKTRPRRLNWRTCGRKHGK